MNQPRYRVIRRKQKTKSIAPHQWIKAQGSMWRAFISDRHPLWWIWNYVGFAGGLYLFYLWVVYFPTIFLGFVGVICSIGSVCALISLAERLKEND